MIKKGDVKVGDYVYTLRIFGTIPSDPTAPILVDRRLVTHIKEYDWGVSLDTKLKTEEGYHWSGCNGNYAYKSLDDIKPLLEKTKRAMLKKRLAEVEKLEQEIRLLQSSEFSFSFKIFDENEGTPVDKMDYEET